MAPPQRLFRWITPPMTQVGDPVLVTIPATDVKPPSGWTLVSVGDTDTTWFTIINQAGPQTHWCVAP